MAPRAVLLALLLAPLARARDADEALSILRDAARGQGEVRAEDVRDVLLEFRGQIVEESTHAVRRTYWYRASDRSFRIRTEPQAMQRERSERGVLGEKGYWDRAADGARVDLVRTNRDHRELIRTIESEREDFERILRMVLLTRLLDRRSSVSLGAPEPVRLEADQPYGAGGILGKDRSEHAYRVVDVERDGEARLRLFVHTGDHTVRKAVQFDADDPAKARWHYYFGPFERREEALGLNLPVFVSMHDGLPEGKEGRERTAKLYGRIDVRLNTDLQDADLKP